MAAKMPPMAPVVMGAPPVKTGMELEPVCMAAEVALAADEVPAALGLPVTEMALVLVGIAPPELAWLLAGAAVATQEQRASAEFMTARAVLRSEHELVTHMVTSLFMRADWWEHWQAKSVDMQPNDLEAAEIRQPCPQDGMAEADDLESVNQDSDSGLTIRGRILLGSTYKQPDWAWATAARPAARITALNCILVVVRMTLDVERAMKDQLRVSNSDRL